MNRPAGPPKMPSERAARRARREELCFTEGDAAGEAEQLRISEAKVRAVFPDSDGDSASVAFRYHGPTREMAALRSGAQRRQLGLKLRARDGCNLLYVMWRIEPKSELVVSFKSNPGEQTHSECGNEGYVNLRPSERGALPELKPESEHELAAALDGAVLSVRLDGEVVWRGAVPNEALALRGPAGFRSDNVDWSLREFRGVPGAQRFAVQRCHAPANHSAGLSFTSGASASSGKPNE